ncbi:MAG: hypothetical protein AB7H86_22350 [Blastocatellales bacterium]
MYQSDNDLLLGLIMFALLAAAGCFLITLTRNHFQARHLQMKLFLIAITVRLAAAIAVYEFGLVNVIGDADSSGFYYGAYYAGLWRKEGVGLFDLPGVLLGALNSYHQGYYYMVGVLMYLSGSVGRMPAAVLNCFYGALTVVFAYRIARSLFSNWTAIRVGWACVFFPSLIIWSCQTLKEPVVIFVECVAIYACVHLKISGFTVRYVLLAAAAILILYPFRFYAAFVAAIAVGVSLMMPQFGKWASSMNGAIAIGVLVIPLAASSGMLARSQAQIEAFDTERIQKFRKDIAKDQGSGVETSFDMRTNTGFVMGTLVGAAHLLLAPFPWQLGGGSVRMVMTLPELLVWWWLFFAGLIPGMWNAIKTKFSLVSPMLVFIVALGLLYSMMFGNVGLVFRQRAQLLPWLLIFAVYGLEMKQLKKLLKQRQQGPLGVQASMPAGMYKTSR